MGPGIVKRVSDASGGGDGPEVSDGLRSEDGDRGGAEVGAARRDAGAQARKAEGRARGGGRKPGAGAEAHGAARRGGQVAGGRRPPPAGGGRDPPREDWLRACAG